MAENFRLIGRGVYTLTEAARLAKVPQRRVKRWALGYWHGRGGGRRFSPPAVQAQLDPIGGIPVLDFADLQEIRLLNAFRNYGVSWHAIRLAAERARDLMNMSHPFSSKRFHTDGRTILARLVDDKGDPQLLDMVRNQWEFDKVVRDYLLGGLDFDEEDRPSQWWPLTDQSGRHHVLVDPARSFGAPIISPGGIRTEILSRSYRAEQSIDMVADWFAVPVEAVRDAVRFEEDLGANHSIR